MNRRGAKVAEDAEKRGLVPEVPETLNALSGKIIGAAIEVHRHLGPGLPERAYERALQHELRLRGVNATRQVYVPLIYKDEHVGQCKIDLVIEEMVVVEVKAVESLTAVHSAQLITYLAVGAYQLGLLINFNVELLRHGIRRHVWSG